MPCPARHVKRRAGSTCFFDQRISVTWELFYHRRTSVRKINVGKANVGFCSTMAIWTGLLSSDYLVPSMPVAITPAMKQQERETQRMLSQIRQQKQQERLEEARNSVSVYR